MQLLFFLRHKWGINVPRQVFFKLAEQILIIFAQMFFSLPVHINQRSADPLRSNVCALCQPFFRIKLIAILQLINYIVSFF
jgi:hypothetical protein